MEMVRDIYHRAPLVGDERCKLARTIVGVGRFDFLLPSRGDPFWIKLFIVFLPLHIPEHLIPLLLSQGVGPANSPAALGFRECALGVFNLTGYSEILRVIGYRHEIQ